MAYNWDKKWTNKKEESMVHTGSWGATHPTKTKMRLTLLVDTERRYGCFEWCDDDGDFYAEGGLWFDDNMKLRDFDGIFDLPPDVYQWLYDEEMLGDWYIQHGVKERGLKV